MLPEAWQKHFAQQRQFREERNLARKLRSLRNLGLGRVQSGSRELINFASNDYLGLALELRIAEAAAAAAGRFGWGAGASRLVAGTSSIHARLEAETAEFRGAEAALVFGSGYQANLGVIATLAGKGDTIFSDAHNHASIVAGCRLSGATVRVFGHRDYDELEKQVGGVKEGRILIVTDSLFSVRGDCADLPRLAKICEKAQALLVVDDAHGNGATGKQGRGVPEIQEALGRTPVVVGTYSKALGSYGGFVACDEDVRDYLVNNSRPFIYTTALPIALAAANLAALKILREEGEARRQKLAKNVRMLRDRLSAAGIEATGELHVLSIPLKKPEQALFYAEQLEQQGLLAYPMRWPTVPEGEDSLRISVSAVHSYEDLTRLINALRVARDRVAGKETTALSQRNPERPAQQSLETTEATLQPDSERHPTLNTATGPIPKTGDFGEATMSPGDAMIAAPEKAEKPPEKKMEQASDSNPGEEYEEVEDVSDELPEDTDFTDDADESDAGKTLIPDQMGEGEVEDPVIAKIEGDTSRRKKRRKTKSRIKTRTRDVKSGD